MSEPIAAEGYADGEPPTTDDDDDGMHWAFELLAEVAVYLVVVSLAVCLVGLTALSLDVTAYGRTILAAGSLAAMASMGLAALVGTFSGMLDPFS
jgi:hypothetical protein